MRLVYKFNNYQNNDELMILCRVSKNLYNQALYAVNRNLDDKGKFLFYYDLNELMKTTKNLEGEINYRKLKTQVAQQCLKILDSNIRGYIKAVKDYAKNKDKYTAKPEMPRYKKRNGYNQLIYTNQSCRIEHGKILFSKTLSIDIPQWDRYGESVSHFKQIRVNPRNGYTEIEIVYDEERQNKDLDTERFAGIDLGLNNLVTMVTDFSQPVIYSGRMIKGINHRFNKSIAMYKSIAEKQNKKKSTKRITALWRNRENTLNDIYHKVSRHIVNLLVENKVGNLVIGYNNGWKDSIDIGKVNNQNFVMISHRKLIDYLTYKCDMVGITVIENEESYTSKCDALVLERICKHNKYKGKRVKRGLFQSSAGKLINADVNGALNIMRKVTCDSKIISRITDKGLLFRPVKIRNLYNLKGTDNFTNSFYNFYEK